MKATEQELADLIYKKVRGNYDAGKDIIPEIAENILSSGLVIPVSALDGMVEELRKCTFTTTDSGAAFETFKTIRKFLATINAIKEEVEK